MNTNPIVVITGATIGLGQLVAIELAKQGANLVLTARNKKKAEMTKKMLNDIVPKAEVDFFFGYLSLMAEVRRVGRRLKLRIPKVNIFSGHSFTQSLNFMHLS